jgi:hypothetical protein
MNAIRAGWVKEGLPNMPEISKKIKVLGLEINVSDVPIKSAEEHFNEYELEDGSKVKVKFSASSFMRVANEHAPDGKPIYLVFCVPAVNVISAPESITGPKAIKPN